MAVDNYHQRRNAISRWNEFTKSEHLSLMREPRKIKFDEHTLFISAITAGDIEEVSKILHNSEAKQAVINQVNSDGLTPLHLACIDENYEIVQLLIKYGANVNISDVDGWTPLHAASGAHSIDVVRELLNAGSSLVCINNDGHLPIDIAEDEEIKSYLQFEYDKHQINIEEVKKEEENFMLNDVNMWIETGVIQDGPHSQGETSLHIAASKGYMSVLKLLLKAGLNINERDADGWTPLHAASHWNKMDIVKYLLDEGASTTLLSNKGLSFIDVAHENMKEDLENYVRSFSIKQAFIRGKGLSKQVPVNSQQIENNSTTLIKSLVISNEDVTKNNKVSVIPPSSKTENKINLDSRTNVVQVDKSNDNKKQLSNEIGFVVPDDLVNSIKMEIPLPKSTLTSTIIATPSTENKTPDLNLDIKKQLTNNKIGISVVLSNIPLPKYKPKTDLLKEIASTPNSVQSQDIVKSTSNIKSAVNMDISKPIKSSTNLDNSIKNSIIRRDAIRPGNTKSGVPIPVKDITATKNFNSDSNQNDNTSTPKITHEVTKVVNINRSNSLRSNENKQSNSILSKAATFGAVLPSSYRRSVDENLSDNTLATSSNQKEVELLKESLELALAKERMLQETLNKLTKEKDELLFKIDQLELEKTKRDSSLDENKKLKDENSALIRVIARLSRETSIDKNISTSTNLIK